MKVGIVGAGVAGLAAARELRRADHDVVLWDKSGGVGGRCATRREGGFTFDPGATSIAPRGLAIEKAMLEELDTTELVRIEQPIHLLSNLRVIAGDPRKNATARYTYIPGNNKLAKLLASDLEIRSRTQIESISRHGSGFEVLGEYYDALILTPPIPQISPLLWSLHESRPIPNARYRSCLSLMLGFDLPAPATSYHALLDPEQRHPLTWLSLESIKSPGRAPEGQCAMVVQLSPTYSQMHYNHDDDAIVEDALGYVRRLYSDDYGSPIVTAVKRWKYSQPDSTAQFDSVNLVGERLIIAGDGVLAGRIESAYESGVLAARRLLESA